MCREDKCLLAAVVPPSAAHGGCGWEQRPLPAVTSHTEPSRALPGLCWGFHTAHRLQGSAAPLLPPCPLLPPSSLSPAHSFCLAPLLGSIAVGSRHLEFCGWAAAERLFGFFSPARGTQGGFLPGPDTPEAGDAQLQGSRVSHGCSSPRGCPMDAWSQNLTHGRSV